MDYSKSIQTIASELKNASALELETSYLISGSSHKIELSNKNQGKKYLSTILYLLQENLSGFNVCPWATDSCKEICLGTKSGHAVMVKENDQTNHVQVARLKRTLLLKNHQEIFLNTLRKELTAHLTKAKKNNVQAVFRFNGTSDLLVETYGLMEQFPEIQFYDYTKSKSRMIKFLSGKMPSNYHLTYSYTPENESDAITILNLGGNVAVVFDEKATTKHKPSFLGKRFLGAEVISGDEHDLRFVDPQGGYVVGLTRKGRSDQKGKAFFVNVDRTEELVAEAA